MTLDRTELEQKCREIWRETLLIHRHAPETRIASSLSPIEILVALYYGGVLAFDPRRPLWPGRDRFIISKGHGSISFYPILADLGFFPREELALVAKAGGRLGGIPDSVIPGYETTNGSLGHGPGVACGMALGLRAKGRGCHVFVLTGDGELYEGSVWEAVMFAGAQKLDNLSLVVDANGAAMLNFTREILDLEPLAPKFAAFGWDVDEVDGHDVAAVRAALLAQKARKNGRPKVLVARTVKGKGVPRLESDPLSHVQTLSPDEVDELLRRRP
jgi:transketolase